MLPDYRVRQRDFLLEIARAITQELDLDKLLKRILQLSADMLFGQASLIILRGEDGGWKVVASHGLSSKLLEYLNPILAEVPDHEDPARFEIPQINQLLQRIARRASLGLLSGVGLPLIVHNQVIGVIFVFRAQQAAFTQNDTQLLQSFADQAAIAVQNAKLYTEVSQEKQRMDAMLDSVADGILIMTPDHVIERVNPAFARLWGKPAEEILSLNHDEVIQFTKIEHGNSLADAEAGGWPLSPQATLYVEGDLIRADRSSIPVGVTYAPLLSLDGRLNNLIATARDISHFREAEEIKSTFISVVSHELKTPVALIKGYVSTLRRDDADWHRDVVADSLAVIEDEADRLAELIENLLDATRLEAGVLSINMTDLSLHTLSNCLAKRFQTQTDKHQIKVEFPDNFPVVLADEARISQVLYNLLSNSIKYSHKGGEIVISGEVKTDRILICVSDEGPGIALGAIPHIFDRFYRAEDAQRKTAGAGLGLYLARAVVEAHKGEIWADPRHKKGARICFSLPRPEQE